MDEKDESLVFVITDGDTSRNSDFEAVKQSLARKHATIYGIGIGTDSDIERDIKENYENAIHVPKVEELPNALIELTKKIIHR